MSHFALAVISETPQDVKRLLAPYQQNNGGDCPQEYLQFYDTEDEHRKRYETGSRAMIEMPDGRKLSPWDEEFRVKGSLGHYRFGGDDPTHKIPEGCKRIEVRFTEEYASFEDFMEGYLQEQPDPETGRYGFWENPNAKWDWYQIGGRWRGALRTTAGARAFTAQIKDLDLEPDREMYQESARRWELIVEGAEFTPDDRYLEVEHFRCLCPAAEMVERYQTKEEYATRTSSLDVWALITLDGKWHEKGGMGAFALTDETRESVVEFNSKLKAALQQADKEHWLTIVDCHI